MSGTQNQSLQDKQSRGGDVWCAIGVGALMLWGVSKGWRSANQDPYARPAPPVISQAPASNRSSSSSYEPYTGLSEDMKIGLRASARGRESIESQTNAIEHKTTIE